MVLALALASAALFGLWHFGISMSGRRLPTPVVVMMSSLGALVVYLAMGMLRADLVFDPRDVTAGILGGLLNLAGTWMSVEAVRYGKIGVVSGITPLYVVVPLAYSMLMGEPLTVIVGVGVIVILIGLVGFAQPWAQREGTSLAPAALALAMASAACWGVAIVVLDIGTRANLYGSLAMSQIPQVVAMSVVLVVLVRRSKTVRVPPLHARAMAPLALSGLALGLASVAFYAAADRGDVGVVSVLGSISPVITALLALLVLRERLTRVEVTALIMVMVGTALVVA